MRYSHHHYGGIGSWIVGGFFLGLGLLLFKVVVAGLALLAALLWIITDAFSPFWRHLVRFVLVVAAICAGLLLLVLVLSDV